jgi:hypothetical protein
VGDLRTARSEGISIYLEKEQRSELGGSAYDIHHPSMPFTAFTDKVISKEESDYTIVVIYKRMERKRGFKQ